MAYISKQNVLSAYKKLSEMHSDPTVQGAAQKVSAIRHFIALDRFYKIHGKDCNTRTKDDKDEFAQLVGITSDVCAGLYTTNFYFPLKPHTGDYCVGSNFYSAGQVGASLVNPEGVFDYPKRGNVPLLKIKNGVLIRDVSLYKNLNQYLTERSFFVSLAVWLLRKEPIEHSEGKSAYQLLYDELSNLFTDELVTLLLGTQEESDTILNDYNLKTSEKYDEISEDDIDELFDKDSNIKDSYNADSFQQIIYGAPGTGKSHSVKKETAHWDKRGRVVRTTFHPDSDYSTFVGCYKPTIENMPLRNNLGQIIGKDGKYISVTQQYAIEDVVTEKKITYEFVAQAFLQAYIEAWSNRDEPEFLVIEEINRGNCAQIFGDLFQLLDRDDEGYSDYAIRADKDLRKHICDELADADIPDFPRVKNGVDLLLPNNLFIRATMNTSDQSLFPIDSAFKRRWDWKYVPIAKGNDEAGNELDWKIEAGSHRYDWWDFISKINKKVFSLTNSEDKQLGFFYCKAKNGIISAETFVSKVIFYLWNDVFRDFGFDDDIFKDKEDTLNLKLSFDKFFLPNGGINADTVIKFLKNLDIKESDIASAQDNQDDEADDSEYKNTNDLTRYQINGNGDPLPKSQVSTELIKLYIQNNPDLSANEVISNWNSLGAFVSHFVENEKKHFESPRSDKHRVNVLECKGEKIYVSTNGWGGKDKMRRLKEAVESKDWGLTFDEMQ